MPVGFIPAVADSINNHIMRGAAYTPPTTYYVKLHVGDPGVAAAANPAGNTTRKAIPYASSSSGGNLEQSADIVWSESEVNTNETYTHISLWSAVTGGTPFMTGILPVTKTVSAGTTVTIKAGDLDFRLTVAS